VIAIAENHPCPRPGPSARFLRKRKAHLKGKSSVSQGFPSVRGHPRTIDTRLCHGTIEEKNDRYRSQHGRVGGIGIPFATLVFTEIVIAAQAVEDNVLPSLHDGYALVFAISLHRHLCSRLTVRPR
jgi:hypothetical protein